MRRKAGRRLKLTGSFAPKISKLTKKLMSKDSTRETERISETLIKKLINYFLR